MIAGVRELSGTITELYEQLAGLVKQAAPQLLAEKGLGVLIAAKLIGEIAGIDHFTSDAQLAHLRMRPDPRLVRTHRSSPPRSWRQPPAQPCLSHARAHQALARPPDRGLPGQTAHERQ